MSFIRKAVVAVSFIFLAAPAKAGLLIEPYAGYNLGVFEITAPAFPGAAVKADLTGPIFGARIGFSIPMFWVGVDYSMASISSKVTSGAATVGNGNATALYAVAGVELPVLLRGWLGYGLSSEFKSDNDTTKFDNMKFGVGFTGFPIVSVNLEYMTQKAKDLGAGIEGKGSAVIVSLSAPFDF